MAEQEQSEQIAMQERQKRVDRTLGDAFVFEPGKGVIPNTDPAFKESLKGLTAEDIVGGVQRRIQKQTESVRPDLKQVIIDLGKGEIDPFKM